MPASRFIRSFISFVFMAVLPAAPQVSHDAAPNYEVYAVEYAVIPRFPISALIASAPKDRKEDIAMMVWVMRAPGKIILFDSGFYRKKFLAQWKPQNFVKSSEALARLGIKPDDVTDVIISHAHWDHAGGAELFSNATVWIQKDEYQYYTGEAWQPVAGISAPDSRQTNAKHGGIDPDDMLALLKINMAGRLRFVNGDDQQIVPGIRCYIGGKHTFQSQFCSVSTRSGTVVLASDNAYLFENLEKHLPIAQTLDAFSNLKAQERMKTLAARPELIIPGHDPLVMTRFPKVAEGVVRID